MGRTKSCWTYSGQNGVREMVVSIWALPVRGRGGGEACHDGLGHFFPTLPGGVRACQDGLGHFFPPRLPV